MSGTTRIRAMLVDDEPLGRRRLRALLTRHEDVEVIAECRNGLEAIGAIEEDRPDVVFLDIQMPQVDGFGVVEAVGSDMMPLTVFVTAYDEFAIQAFEAQAIDYLLKPVEETRFNTTLQRVRTTLNARRHQPIGAGDLASLLQHVRSNGEPVRRLLVRSGPQYTFVRDDEIEWIEAADNYVALHVGPKRFLIRETVSGMEAKLDPTRFLRIRKSAIVNLDYVQHIQPWSSSEFQIVLRNGTKVLSSRSFRDSLRRLMLK